MRSIYVVLSVIPAMLAISPIRLNVDAKDKSHGKSVSRSLAAASHKTIKAKAPLNQTHEAAAKVSREAPKLTAKKTNLPATPPSLAAKSLVPLPTGPAESALASMHDEDGKTTPEDTLCSINAANFDLAKILRDMSDMTGANLLLLSSPDQKLTLRLSNVKMIDMLRHVCALTGTRYLKVGGTYVVAPEESLKKAYAAEWKEAFPPAPIEPKPTAPTPISSLYMLQNITAEKAAEVLRKAFAEERLKVVAGPAYSSPSLKSREAGATTGVAGSAVEREASAGASKAVVLMGLPSDVALAKDILSKIDLQRPQVVISVSIHDITNDALKDIGLPWTFGDITITESNPNGLNFGSFSRAPQSMASQLKALEKTSAAKLLASPSVSVLDGESAFILIGDKISYPVLVGYSQANTPIFSKETERVGIYLQLSCQVAEDGTITLALYPQVSSVTGFLEVNGASYPQVSTREAQTTLRFRSGETVVMGGLMKDEDIVTVDRVPLLSKIPLIGELFSHRKKTKSSSQVIITITPTIIDAKKP